MSTRGRGPVNDAIDPETREVVFAATGDGNIFRNSDSGTSWPAAQRHGVSARFPVTTGFGLARTPGPRPVRSVV